MNQYRIVEYSQTDEFFIYDTLTGLAHYIENQEDRSKLRSIKDNYICYDGNIPLERVSINVTGNCNMKCSHCYYASVLENIELPINTISDLFKQFYEMGVLQVGITGGEPTLHTSLPQIIRSATDNRLFVTLASNGVLLTPDLLRRLYNYGLRVVGISLDSVKEETHNKIRNGYDTWKPLLNNIKSIYELDFVNDDPQFHINVATVISKMNYTEIEEVFCFLNSLSHSVRWHVNYINFVGNAKTHELSLTLTKNELVEKINTLGQLTRNTNVTLSLGRFITEYISIEDDTRSILLSENPSYTKCCGTNGEFERFCVLNFDGFVYPCTNVVDQLIGNIGEKRFIDIWENDKMSQYKSLQIHKVIEPCEVCLNAHICQKVGACRCQTAITKFKNTYITARFV